MEDVGNINSLKESIIDSVGRKDLYGRHTSDSHVGLQLTRTQQRRSELTRTNSRIYAKILQEQIHRCKRRFHTSPHVWAKFYMNTHTDVRVNFIRINSQM